MKLRKKTGADANGTEETNSSAGLFGRAVNRRTFLRHSGVTASGAALATIAAPTMVKKAVSYTHLTLPTTTYV